jgi:hypothetical protein
MLGWALLFSPFVGLAVYLVRTDGWRLMLEVYGLCVLLVVFLAAGSYLVTQCR